MVQHLLPLFFAALALTISKSVSAPIPNSPIHHPPNLSDTNTELSPREPISVLVTAASAALKVARKLASPLTAAARAASPKVINLAKKSAPSLGAVASAASLIPQGPSTREKEVAVAQSSPLPKRTPEIEIREPKRTRRHRHRHMGKGARRRIEGTAATARSYYPDVVMRSFPKRTLEIEIREPNRRHRHHDHHMKGHKRRTEGKARSYDGEMGAEVESRDPARM